MNVAVLGGGPGAYATAADLTLAGHRVCLWRRRAADLEPVRRAGGITIVADGRRETAAPDRLTADLAGAVAGAEVVVVALPAGAQPDLAARLATALDGAQIVLLTPGTFGSYVVARDIARAGGPLPFAFAETGTLPYLAHRTGPAEVAVRARAVNLPAGVFPAAATAETLDRLRVLIPGLRPCRDALDAALTNPGPVVHPALLLLHAGDIDAGRFTAHADPTAPSVRRLVETVDRERLAIRAGLGHPPPHYPLAAHDGGAPAAGGWFSGEGPRVDLMAGGAAGDVVTFEHRWVTEDAALGLSLFESAGRLAGTDTPAIGGMLSVFQAVLGFDLRAAGRGLDRLGLGDLVQREIRQLLREGWRSPLWRRALSG
jgi:opine dehydrogenase